MPEVGKKRVVVIGGGFAGMTLVKCLDPELFQVVLLDRNNYHQFQPLFYQVAMAGLEPSSIVFPFRKMLQGTGKYFRMAEVTAVEPHLNRLLTSHGIVNYDYLVLALGAETHYFGNEEIRSRSIPMKSVSEALYLRNRILEDCETALTCTEGDERRGLLNTVIVGGGPTGVELAGALAEMRKFVMPKDYPELPTEESGVWLVESNGRLLKSMSVEASARSASYLEDMGVRVLLGKRVESYDGKWAHLRCGTRIRADKVIWAAGVSAPKIPGLPDAKLGQGSRLVVDRCNRLEGYRNIFAVGDLALMSAPGFEDGHPQVASVAIDQARLLSGNLGRAEGGESMEEFSYVDKGSMATVGRHAAVADIGSLRLSGVTAWLLWLLVHLRALLGVKNKLFVLVNWGWNYVTYDQPLRIIVRPRRLSD